MKMKIKMLENRSGHDVDEKGINQPAKQYAKGEVYDVHQELAMCFLQEKTASVVEEEKLEGKKALKGAPENK